MALIRAVLGVVVAVSVLLSPAGAQAESLDELLKRLEKQIEEVERQVEETERQVDDAEQQVAVAECQVAASEWLLDHFAPGAVVALQGTPHLWFVGAESALHWGGDTRALAGKHIVWSNRLDTCLEAILVLTLGDPWLSAGLLKDGDPIYLVKWESEWAKPKLLHILSIADVEAFGINETNYGRFVLDRATWEARYGLSAAELERGVLARAAQ